MNEPADRTERQGHGRPIPFGPVWVRCQIGLMLLAGGYLGQVLDRGNRLYGYLDWRDTLALIVLLAGGGLLAAAGLHACMRMAKGRMGAWLSPWFFFFVVQAGFNFFPVLRQKLVLHWPWMTGTAYYLLIWGTGLGLTAAGYAWPRMRKTAIAGCRRLGLLWPLLVLLPVRLLWAPKWPDSGMDPLDLGRNDEGRGAAAVILILDMIGYDDMWDAHGNVRSELPALVEFSKTSTIYHRARSCGDFTSTSLPGLMLQEEVTDPLVMETGVYWRLAGGSNEPPRLPGDFLNRMTRPFQLAGGRAVYIGYYLPYATIMPGIWDGVHSPCFYGVVPSGGTSAWKAALYRQWVGYLTASKDPLAGMAKQFNAYTPMLDRYHRQLTWGVLEAGTAFIREALSPGDLVIIHLTVPHPPIVFNAEGGASSYGREDPEGYEEQLRYADRLFGELTDVLHAAGRWDDSWVVMLSDHGSHFKDWSQNPEGKRHVPLMVKAPGQTAREDDHDMIRLADFRQIPGFFPAPPAAEE